VENDTEKKALKEGTVDSLLFRFMADSIVVHFMEVKLFQAQFQKVASQERTDAVCHSREVASQERREVASQERREADSVSGDEADSVSGVQGQKL